MLQYDYSKLRGKIVEVYGGIGKFAEAYGWSLKTTSFKMNNRIAWTQTDIAKACELLGIENNEINEYFFKVKV